MPVRAFAACLIACLYFAGAAANPIDDALASERMPGDSSQDSWRKPADVLRFFELAPGQHVLDFYAGPGYYSELVARIVGPSGSVILYNDALYTEAAYHDVMLRLAHKRLPNVHTLNRPANYLDLPPASLDRVLFVLVYHDLYWRPANSPEPLGDPKIVLRSLFAALKPKGMVVVLDHVADDTPRDQLVPVASRLHRIDPKQVRADFEQAGFEFAGESDVLHHADDVHSMSVFNPAVRHRTDQFLYKFRKP